MTPQQSLVGTQNLRIIPYVPGSVKLSLNPKPNTRIASGRDVDDDDDDALLVYIWTNC